MASTQHATIWRELPRLPAHIEACGLAGGVALTYSKQVSERRAAPCVVAKGDARRADEIVARAHAAGVPIDESRELVLPPMQVDLDAHIRPALYIAVAEVLAWVYRIEGRAVPAGAPREEKC